MYEPFVLAMQAAQVYYTAYPSLRRDKNDGWDVCKMHTNKRTHQKMRNTTISFNLFLKGYYHFANQIL